MIYTERKVNIKNDVATIDNPIVLFRGDREIEILFTVIDHRFRFSNTQGNVINETEASYGQLAVALPDGTDLFTEIANTNNGTVTFTITGEMIDEIHEVGFYSFHIRLYNEDKTSRITLPPVMKGIEIREPLVIEGDVENTDLVGDATVGYSMVQTVGTDEEVFDEDGNYIPTVWSIGDKITAEKLNKIEKGVSNKKITIDDVDFIDVVRGINACNNNNSKIGCYNAEGVYSSSSKYRYNEIEVKPGQIVKGIAGNDINYKIFVLLDDNNIIGVTSKDSTYIVTRTYVVIDSAGYYCYEFTVPEGVSKIYYQYEASMLGVSDMIIIDSDMPSSYTPYIEELMLDENIHAQNSKKAEYANNIISPLNGKNIGFLGDSFTASATSYHAFIAERTGCTAHNYGVGGTRIALDSDSGLSFIHRVENMQDDLDMICVFGGINDASKYELYTSRYGTIEDAILTDEEIADGVAEPSTFYAAVKTLLSQLITKYPEKPIVLIIPPHVLDASYEPSLTAYAGIKKIVDALRECAEYYAIPTIDLYKNAQYLNNHPSNVALYRVAMNNIHPNSKAYMLMSYDIQKALEKIIWK